MPRPVVHTERGDWRTWGGQRHTPAMRLPHPTPGAEFPARILSSRSSRLALSVLPKAVPTPHHQASTGLVDSLQLMEREPRPEGSGGGLLFSNYLCGVNQHLWALKFLCLAPWPTRLKAPVSSLAVAGPLTQLSFGPLGVEGCEAARTQVSSSSRFGKPQPDAAWPLSFPQKSPQQNSICIPICTAAKRWNQPRPDVHRVK